MSGQKGGKFIFFGVFFLFDSFFCWLYWDYIVGVGTTPVSATPTHTLCVCVNSLDDPLLSRGEHCSPAKKHKATFFL